MLLSSFWVIGYFFSEMFTILKFSVFGVLWWFLVVWGFVVVLFVFFCFFFFSILISKGAVDTLY